MAIFSGPLQALIDELGRLPGVGPKSAQRITFHLLKVAPEDALRLAEAIIAVKERITLCPRCFNVAGPPAKADGAPRHPDRQRPAGGRGSGVRRRTDPGPGIGGPAGGGRLTV